MNFKIFWRPREAHKTQKAERSYVASVKNVSKWNKSPDNVKMIQFQGKVQFQFHQGPIIGHQNEITIKIIERRRGLEAKKKKAIMLVHKYFGFSVQLRDNQFCV